MDKKNNLQLKIINFLRSNLRIFVALSFLSYIFFPIAIKIIEISKNKPFFSTNASKPVNTLPELKLNRFNYGFYSQEAIDSKEVDYTFNHEYVNWDDTFDQNNITKALEKSIATLKHPIITLEPWNYSKNISNNQHFRDIVDGKYDKYIINTCKKINSINTVTLVNFAEGADFGSMSRFSWAIDDPILYKQGYMRWHKKCKEVTNNVIFVWSAFGTKKASDYYPGDEFVDILGLNLLINENDLTNSKKKKLELTKIIEEKMKNVSSINKIVYLLDFGIQNPNQNSDYVEEFVNILKENKFPKILGAIYLNTNSSPSLISGTDSFFYKLPTELLNKTF
jgi:endoglucanase